MFRTILFMFALIAGFFAAPSAIDSKEQRPVLLDIASTRVAPCPVLVTVTPAAPTHHAKTKTKVKKKSKHRLHTEQTKKKHVSGSHHHKSKVPQHHKSIPSHHHNVPVKIFPALGPLHLTSPPGCG